MAKITDVKVDGPCKRLRGALPKIGIRPAIDGRMKGIRESLEERTMGMAKSVAEFLSERLRHPNGLPVECVISDTCIGGMAEAAECADKFAREGVGDLLVRQGPRSVRQFVFPVGDFCHFNVKGCDVALG